MRMNPRAIRTQLSSIGVLGALLYVIMNYISAHVFVSHYEGESKFAMKDKHDTLLQDGYSETENTIHKNEVHHIAFIKVHRTGSGTLKQIFLKFGHNRNLTFVSPNLRYTHTRGVISEVESLTNQNILPLPKFQSYDILCHHVIYNADAFKAIFPKDTVYIGAVRDPISRFQSAIYFFEPEYILQLEGPTPLSTYSVNPLMYEPNNPRLSMTNNRMAVDFGFPIHLFPGHLKNVSINGINEYIKQLDNDFQLIIVNELFDESLVLMKRLLNWSIKDILYLRKHVTMTSTKRNTLSKADILNLKDFLYLDYALYNFAMNRIKTQIVQEGESFKHEVVFFKHVIKVFQIYCSDLKQQQSPRHFQITESNGEFEFSKTDCIQLKMKDLNEKRNAPMHEDSK